MNKDKMYKVVLDLDGEIVRCGDNMDTAMSPEDFGEITFGQLRSYLIPEPLKGRVNKVLRKYMCTMNSNSKYELNEIGREYADGPPSNIRWDLSVLPMLAELVKKEYGTSHLVHPWVMGVLKGDLVKYVGEDEYTLEYH